MMLRKSAFYIFVAFCIFGIQFKASSSLVTGKPPRIEPTTLGSQDAMAKVSHGPAMLYFWAEWCGICRGMKPNIEAVLPEYPVLTVAVRSGDNEEILRYLSNNKITWPVVNDNNGQIGESYGVRGVPAIFFINDRGEIVLTTAGFTTEWGLRIRLWLVQFL